MQRKNVKKRKKKQRNIVVVISVAVIAVCFVILGVYLLKDKKAKKTDATAKVEEDPQAVLVIEEAGEEVQLPDLKTSEYETDEITMGIDVSEFQGNINWKAVADTGIDFVMVRVGYRGMTNGKIQEDACARYNLQEAEKNGLKLGAYFFSTAITEEEAKEEAKWACDLLAGYPITYPVAYNCEGFQNESSRQHDLSIEERTNLASAFLETIEENDYVGMFYAAKSELENNHLWDADALALEYRTWVAQYSKPAWPEKKEPDYSNDYAMWQYTSQGKIAGIKKPVDFNVAYFGYSQSEEAVDESSAQHVEVDVEVGVKFEEVEQLVTARDEVNLRSTMNQGGSGNIVCRLKNGDTATRTGIGNNGWSRVIYNGQKLYCVSSFLTTDLSYTTPKEEVSEFKTQFKKVSEKVTAKDVTNLRNRPSVEEPAKVIAQLKHGDVAIRTGVANEGWSRVEYNGQVLYCVSSYLEIVQ